ncbi:MAG: dUTP diphosphatase [Deltaproteobacteria bacterium]|nr:MAG: dUTP diphosphatase [Deltaproteobacteria bacterium]
MKVKLVGDADPSFIPERKTDGAVGFDLRARVDGELVLKPFERALIPTGIAISMPPWMEAQVRPRSGLAAKHGVTLLNSPGTVDPDYRGEIKVIAINLGSDEFRVRRGDRIAQLVFSRTIPVSLETVDELDETARGKGGFGSTGK